MHQSRDFVPAIIVGLGLFVLLDPFLTPGVRDEIVAALLIGSVWGVVRIGRWLVDVYSIGLRIVFQMRAAGSTWDNPAQTALLETLANTPDPQALQLQWEVRYELPRWEWARRYLRKQLAKGMIYIKIGEWPNYYFVFNDPEPRRGVRVDCFGEKLHIPIGDHLTWNHGAQPGIIDTLLVSAHEQCPRQNEGFPLTASLRFCNPYLFRLSRRGGGSGEYSHLWAPREWLLRKLVHLEVQELTLYWKP